MQRLCSRRSRHRASSASLRRSPKRRRSISIRSRACSSAQCRGCARPVAPAPRAHARSAMRPIRVNRGGGFIEFLFSGVPRGGAALQSDPIDAAGTRQPYRRQQEASLEAAQPERRPIDPKFLKQIVAYHGPEKPGTIIIDTPQRFLFLVQEDGQAMRYGIGVGKPGFTWAGEKKVSAKKEWPDWTPPHGDAGAAAGPAALHGRRPGKSAGRARHVSRLLALPHPWLERALDDRHRRCRPAASACATRTSSTSTSGSRSAPRWW